LTVIEALAKPMMNTACFYTHSADFRDSYSGQIYVFLCTFGQFSS